MMSKSKIILLALLEGFVVLSVEILTAKMLTPYFGSSIYIWTTVLGVTLIGLATGYYIGSYFSKKSNLDQILYFTLQLSALSLMILPFSIHPVLQLTRGMNIVNGVLLATMLTLFPALTIISSTSPLLIQLFTASVRQSGKQSGWIFACLFFQ